MCGRFQQRRDPRELAELFGAELLDDELVGDRYNVAPTQLVAAIVERGGDRELGAYRWGLVPPWAKNTAISSRLINARAETMEERPAYRVAFERRRCVVPADGFYEWRGGQPFLIAPHSGGALALAGLWSVWREPATGTWLRSCAIVTTAANETVRALHDRMPVILDPSTIDVWLDTEASLAEARHLLQLPAEEPLSVRPVSSRLNNVQNEGAGLMDAGAPPAGHDLSIWSEPNA